MPLLLPAPAAVVCLQETKRGGGGSPLHYRATSDLVLSLHILQTMRADSIM